MPRANKNSKRLAGGNSRHVCREQKLAAVTGLFGASGDFWVQQSSNLYILGECNNDQQARLSLLRFYVESKKKGREKGIYVINIPKT